jgi:hypothetical protein
VVLTQAVGDDPPPPPPPPLLPPPLLLGGGVTVIRQIPLMGSSFSQVVPAWAGLGRPRAIVAVTINATTNLPT